MKLPIQISPDSKSLRAGAPLVVLAALHAVATAQGGAPTTPVYTTTYSDAVTGDNEIVEPGGARGWAVDAGADSYQNDVYERPMTQTFDLGPNGFQARQYYQNLDIVSARAGYDARFLYVSIDLYGIANSTQGGDIVEGLNNRYGFRFSTNADGRFGWLFQSESPVDANPVPVAFGALKNFAFRDLDGDVGGAAQSGPTGLAVTKTDNIQEEFSLDGYDLPVISDGARLDTGAVVMWSRVHPTDPSIVEIAVDYAALGLTQADLAAIRYFEIEANRGMVGEQNYLWNDKYTANEAGSPNLGVGGSSEFGTNGLVAIYEVDTLRAGTLGAPSAIEAYCFGDGSGVACPCGNSGAPGNGCANSLNPAGANLSGTGSPSIAADTLVLAGAGMPDSSVLYFQGSIAVGQTFGDGLRCAGGSVVRLGTKTNVGGASQYPGSGDAPISVRGSVTAGSTRQYQAWYRNVATFCTVEGFNTTNGVRVTWLP